MLLRYSLKPSPKSRVLVTVGSVMTIGLLIDGCLHSKEVGAAVPFSPPTYNPSFSELGSSAFVKLNETDNMCVWCGLTAAFGGWFYDMILFILGITFSLMNPSPARSGGWWRSGNGHFPPACQERKKLSTSFHFLSYSSLCFRICCLP